VTTPATAATAELSVAGKAGEREFIILVVALMACGALAIDTILPAFADVRAEFGMPADSTRVGWLVTAFFLGLAIGPWLYGPASDRFGRRRPLQAGLVLYIVAGVTAALAPSWGLMVAARFVWGLGAAGPRSLAVALVRDRYSGDAMARLMSLIMAVFLLVPILAPAIGAGMIAVLPWRAVYWFPAATAVALLLWTRRLPETLPADRRRPFTARAVAAACRDVVSNRQTLAFTAAMTFLFGVMTTYLAGSEIVVGEVFGYGDWFPLFFGLIAVLLAISALNNARLVQRIGLIRLARRMAQVGLITAWLLVAVAFTSGGQPSFWVFTLALAAVVPVAQGLVPNCNTAAMLPLPHIAGTASAVIGTITTAGGAMLGGAVTTAFDGTVRPFALGIAVLVTMAAALIMLVATERA
jgi:DHA1 family bicyclomycin/chloramphenicol resistance-like MFS transporter